MEHRLISTEDLLLVGVGVAISDGLPEAPTGVAIGPEALLTGTHGVAVGASCRAGRESVAIGGYAQAGGQDAVAVGAGAGASAAGQVAIGAGIGLGGDSPNAIAIGRMADAGADGIAIGANVYAPAGQTMIGGPGTIASFGGDLAIPVVTDPPSTPPADPTKAVIRFCSGNGAVYVWSGSAWSVIG